MEKEASSYRKTLLGHWWLKVEGKTSDICLCRVEKQITLLNRKRQRWQGKKGYIWKDETWFFWGEGEQSVCLNIHK